MEIRKKDIALEEKVKHFKWELHEAKKKIIELEAEKPLLNNDQVVKMMTAIAEVTETLERLKDEILNYRLFHEYYKEELEPLTKRWKKDRKKWREN